MKRIKAAIAALYEAMRDVGAIRGGKVPAPPPQNIPPFQSGGIVGVVADGDEAGQVVASNDKGELTKDTAPPEASPEVVQALRKLVAPLGSAMDELRELGVLPLTEGDEQPPWNEIEHVGSIGVVSIEETKGGDTSECPEFTKEAAEYMLKATGLPPNVLRTGSAMGKTEYPLGTGKLLIDLDSGRVHAALVTLEAEIEAGTWIRCDMLVLLSGEDCRIEITRETPVRDIMQAVWSDMPLQVQLAAREPSQPLSDVMGATSDVLLDLLTEWAGGKYRVGYEPPEKRSIFDLGDAPVMQMLMDENERMPVEFITRNIEFDVATPIMQHSGLIQFLGQTNQGHPHTQRGVTYVVRIWPGGAKFEVCKREEDGGERVMSGQLAETQKLMSLSGGVGKVTLQVKVIDQDGGPTREECENKFDNVDLFSPETMTKAVAQLDKRAQVERQQEMEQRYGKQFLEALNSQPIPRMTSDPDAVPTRVAPGSIHYLNKDETLDLSMFDDRQKASDTIADIMGDKAPKVLYAEETSVSEPTSKITIINLLDHDSLQKFLDEPLGNGNVLKMLRVYEEQVRQALWLPPKCGESKRLSELHYDGNDVEWYHHSQADTVDILDTRLMAGFAWAINRAEAEGGVTSLVLILNTKSGRWVVNATEARFTKGTPPEAGEDFEQDVHEVELLLAEHGVAVIAKAIDDRDVAEQMQAELVNDWGCDVVIQVLREDSPKGLQTAISLVHNMTGPDAKCVLSSILSKHEQMLFDMRHEMLATLMRLAKERETAATWVYESLNGDVLLGGAIASKIMVEMGLQITVTSDNEADVESCNGERVRELLDDVGVYGVGDALGEPQWQDFCAKLVQRMVVKHGGYIVSKSCTEDQVIEIYKHTMAMHGAELVVKAIGITFSGSALAVKVVRLILEYGIETVRDALTRDQAVLLVSSLYVTYGHEMLCDAIEDQHLARIVVKALYDRHGPIIVADLSATDGKDVLKTLMARHGATVMPCDLKPDITEPQKQVIVDMWLRSELGGSAVTFRCMTPPAHGEPIADYLQRGGEGYVCAKLDHKSIGLLWSHLAGMFDAGQVMECAHQLTVTDGGAIMQAVLKRWGMDLVGHVDTELLSNFVSDAVADERLLVRVPGRGTSIKVSAERRPDYQTEDGGLDRAVAKLESLGYAEASKRFSDELQTLEAAVQQWCESRGSSKATPAWQMVVTYSKSLKDMFDAAWHQCTMYNQGEASYVVRQIAERHGGKAIIEGIMPCTKVETIKHIERKYGIDLGDLIEFIVSGKDISEAERVYWEDREHEQAHKTAPTLVVRPNKGEAEKYMSERLRSLLDIGHDEVFIIQRGTTNVFIPLESYLLQRGISRNPADVLADILGPLVDEGTVKEDLERARQHWQGKLEIHEPPRPRPVGLAPIGTSKVTPETPAMGDVDVMLKLIAGHISMSTVPSEIKSEGTKALSTLKRVLDRVAKADYEPTK